MAIKSQFRPTPVVYELGVDITSEQYNEVVGKIADWFVQSGRKTEEPVAAAKYALDCCLKGVKADGKTPWPGAELLSWQKRVKMSCRFDVETMSGLESGSEKTKKKKEQARQAKAKKAAAGDPQLPAEYTDPRRGDKTYGSDPLQFFTTKELERREALKAGYLDDYPQLQAIAAQAKLDMLLDSTLILERFRLRQAASDKTDFAEMRIQDLSKRIVDLEKALGIDPASLAKLQKDREGGSIGDAILRLEEMENKQELWDQATVEELLLIFQMYYSPSPREDMGGKQLDEVGLYGMTKCRTCHCSGCGQHNYAGLPIKDIKDYLVRMAQRGVGGLVKVETPIDTYLAEHAAATETASGDDE